MDEFLKTQYRRKIFYVVISLLILVLYFTKFYLLPLYFQYPIPSSKDIWNSILDNLLSTVLVTVVIATIIFWLTPPALKKATMEVIDPFQIKHELKEARTNTRFWSYKGGCGRFTRTVTIPELAAEAKATNQHKQISIQILDVTNEEVCQNYVDYRNSLRSADEAQRWTLERVRLELYATIVTAYCWKAQVPLLDVTVGLINSISLFRIDLSDKKVIITKEDKQEPGLKCDYGTLFYNSYFEELRLSLKQARVLSNQVKGKPIDLLEQTNLEELLKSLGIFTNSLTGQDMSKIIDLIKKSKNPYA